MTENQIQRVNAAESAYRDCVEQLKTLEEQLNKLTTQIVDFDRQHKAYRAYGQECDEVFVKDLLVRDVWLYIKRYKEYFKAQLKEELVEVFSDDHLLD